MAATRLDTVLSSTGTTLSFTVSAGSNRMLVVGLGHELDGSSEVTGVDYGGQALTKVEGITTPDAGLSCACALWILLETGIAAAGGTTITGTWSTGPSNSQIVAGSYAGINQSGGASTTPATATAESNEATPDPTVSDLTETVDGIVVCVHTEGNNIDVNWGTDMTDQKHQADTSSATDFSDRLAITSGNVNIEGDAQGTRNRVAQCAAAFAPFVVSLGSPWYAYAQMG